MPSLQPKIQNAYTRASDAVVYGKYLAMIGKELLGIWARLGPGEMIRASKRYPWASAFGKIFPLYNDLVASRTGRAAEANAVLVYELAAQGTRAMEMVLSRPDHLILNEDLVPPEIFFAMGLESWFTEFLGFQLPMLDQQMAQDYLDFAENNGIPPDVCSLPRHMMGLTLKGDMPKPAAMVTSNSPCDGGMASYRVMAKELGCPLYYLDVPYHFHTPRSVDYFTDQLFQLVEWLEEHTPGKMDWDRLVEVCEERNRMQQAESALWDMMAAKPAPMAAEPVYLTHLWSYIMRPGTPECTRMVEKIAELARKNLREGKGAVPDERHRVLMWGPFLAFYTDFWPQVEQRYKTSLIIDSLSFNRLPPVDTSSPQAMMRSLAQLIMAGPMARHSRGPASNYFDDLFFAVEKFNIDMVWLAGHVGCKNSQALNGMLREKCRERGVPLLILDFDLSDSRIVPKESIMARVDHFMENVMQDPGAGKIHRAA